MHRGRPLYLSEERYAALTYLVWIFSKDTNVLQMWVKVLKKCCLETEVLGFVYGHNKISKF
jgi:hypothetical protein